MAGIGHNGIAKDQLRSIIERIERLEEEKRSMADTPLGEAAVARTFA